MSDIEILWVAISVWMGFSFSLQVRTQTQQDRNILTGDGRARRVLARLIYFIVGLAGVLGMAGLIGNIPALKGPVFPLGFISGVLLFLLTVLLRSNAAEDSR